MRHIFIILAFLAVLPYASAQTARVYTSENGLPNSQVSHIYQDKNGYIWMCSEGGLIRFDGMRFETFRHDRERENSISSSSVNNMVQDSRGNTWVATANGLNLFDMEHSEFRRFELHDERNSVANPYISALQEVPGRSGGCRLYVATSGSGVFVIDCNTMELLPDAREQLYRQVPSDYIRMLFMDSGKHLWVFPEGTGFPVILDMSTLEPSPILNWSPELLSHADQIRIGNVAEDPLTGDLLIGSTEGLLYCKAGTGLVRKAAGKQAAATSATTILFNGQAASGERRSFLVGNKDGGLLLFDTATEEVRDAALPSIRQDISGWSATTSTIDSQGNIWLSIYQRGVMVAPQSMFGFSYMGCSSRGIPGENSACITAIYEDGKDLWIATDGAGIFRKPLEGAGPERNYTSENTALTDNSVMGLTGDKHGNLWIGTYNAGLFYMDAGGTIRPFADQDLVGTVRIRTLAYDPARDLVYVGTSGAGLTVINAATRRHNSQSIDDQYRWVSALRLDANGLLWVGSYNGPWCYDPSSGRAVAYSIPSGSDTPLRIYGIGNSPDGTMWFGTDDGLFSVDETSREIRQYTEADGLSSNVIRDILCTANGEIWVSTLNGLSRLSPRSGKIDSFHSYDGLQGNEFRSGAACKASSGRLYFGGLGGITYFSPLLVDGSGHNVPQVSLARLTVLDRDVQYNPDAGSNNLIDKHISEATKIEIPRETDLFSLAFSVPEYTNPQRLVYAYRLRGFDADWKTASARQPSATYTNVPPGRYRFEVKVYFAGAPDDFSLRSVDVHVEAPWYRSGAAYAAYLLLLAGLTGLLFYLSRQRKRREEEKKEAELKELRLGLFTNLTHEIRTPLNLVMSPLGAIREAEQDPEKKETYNLMYRNCLRINRIVNQFMDLRKVDAGQMQLHFRETDIIFFIRDIMQSFDKLAQSKRIDFSLASTHDEEPLWIDQGNFDKIIYNILSNAFKHTPEGGRIRVDVSGLIPNRGELRNDIRDYVQIRIFNSGSRIEEAWISRIFDRFVQVNPHDASSGSGVGLNLTKLLVELHHGHIVAENEEDGVVFRVLVPAGKEHLTREELSYTSHHKDLYTKTAPEEHEDETYVKEATPEDKAARAKKTVVVVDDDDDTREYLKTLLRGRYNVSAFANAEAAWQAVSATLPDAVVTDLVMPGMSGSELCAQIRRDDATRHIPVIILTGQNGEQEEQAASDSGADKFLSKPISVELLLSCVAQVISAREAIKDKFGVKFDYDYTGIQMGSADEKLLRRIVESVQAHLEDPDYDVSSLCEDVGISRVHLNRKLKALGKDSPGILIKTFRMKQAAYLLANNQVNVSEVAYRVGFASHSYFSSSFKEFFGITPRDFVARLQENPDDASLKQMFE